MANESRLKLWLPLIGALILIAGIWTGYLLAGGDSISPAQQKLQTIFELIDEEYVDEISTDSLVEMTIPVMLKNLDPHTAYIPLNELERANRDMESSFVGIGVQFQIMADSICVVEVLAGGPAQQAGILAGDRIVAVDSLPLVGPDLTQESAIAALRGAKDTPVKVTVMRGTPRRTQDFELIRAEVPSTSVDAAYLIDENIGYVKLIKFAPNTYAEFLQALSNLLARGAESFIIDLRGNTGGLVDQAILIANEFLQPYQTIVETRGRNLRENANWLADGTGTFLEAPLVILVDEFTASASEIVAGAIQDNDRGLILGRRSFGKGLVQRPVVLPDSSMMRLTVQRYYTPSGRCIQKDFTRGEVDVYDREVVARYESGEVFSADSVKLHNEDVYTTVGGRKVYGGGGIMPDVFVPTDTTGYTNYFMQVSNKGLLNRFAYEYADLNRADLSKAKNVEQLLKKLPSNDVLLWSFVKYASDNGIPQRWYYINISARLIVNQLRALIARDILGMNAYYEITNGADTTVEEAIKQIRQGVPATIESALSQQKPQQSNENE